MSKSSSRRSAKAWRGKTADCPYCGRKLRMSVGDTWEKHKFHCDTCRKRVA